MDGMKLNTILGTLLAAVLVALALANLSDVVFPKTSLSKHHGDDHHDETLNESIAKKYAYYVTVVEAGASGMAEEEVFDLGLALASADLAKGERSFVSKCVTCHTIERGGANGTGPNLYNVVGAKFRHIDGFNYSRALMGKDDTWTYENLNNWLHNPSAYLRGTSMSFAGLRRDDERANMIAYLASMSPQAPEPPKPLK